MRLWVTLAGLLLVGCAEPHSTGSLWSLENLDRESAFFRLADQQRADQAYRFELGLADESLAAERARIEAGLRECPGPSRQALALSPGNRLRDSIRTRIQGDATRLARVAQLARADWRLRRARATGDSRFCDWARSELTGRQGEPATSNVLQQLGSPTVARDAVQSRLLVDPEPLSAVSLYASGWTDAVRAASPLPQYLAAVYGGQLLTSATPPVLHGQSPESVVDSIAAAYPGWEPDAVYAALRAP